MVFASSGNIQAYLANNCLLIYFARGMKKSLLIVILSLFTAYSQAQSPEIIRNRILFVHDTKSDHYYKLKVDNELTVTLSGVQESRLTNIMGFVSDTMVQLEGIGLVPLRYIESVAFKPYEVRRTIRKAGYLTLAFVGVPLVLFQLTANSGSNILPGMAFSLPVLMAALEGSAALSRAIADKVSLQKGVNMELIIE